MFRVVEKYFLLFSFFIRSKIVRSVSLLVEIIFNMIPVFFKLVRL